MRDVNSSNKINNFEITRNFSMKLWMERKEKGQSNLTQLKQPPFGERYGRKRSVTMKECLGWRKLSRNSVQIEVQEDINITIEDIRTGVSKMANWKAAGPDLVQGYWFKKLPGLHARLQLHLQDCVNL